MYPRKNNRRVNLKRFSPHFVSGFITVLLFAIIGTYFLVNSHAATLIGDLNGDGTVNIFDLSLLLSSYGQTTTACTSSTQYTCDLNSDGTVNIFDLSILLNHWGQTAGGGAAPTNSVGPYFTASTGTTAACSNGCAIVGQTLGVNTGTWSPTPTTYTYQWERCTTTSAQPPTTGSCAAISGATNATYTVQSSDSGHSLVPIVTAYNGSTASAPTVVSGSCQTGEVVAGTMAGTLSPTSQIASCSPISAVVATAQAGEKFCTNSVTTCGYADPLNGTAGVPAGTTLSTTGACATYANGGSITTNGTVVNGCKITGFLDIRANNVTIENSDISQYNEDDAVINQESGFSGVQLLNDSIHGPSPTTGDSLAWAFWNRGGNSTENDVYVYNIDRILVNNSSGTSTVTNSFCWSNGGGAEHHECIYDGGLANSVVDNTVLDNMRNETAAIFYDNPDSGGTGTTGILDAENDIFSGGSYTIYGGQGAPGDTGHTGMETYIGDRWTRICYTTGGLFGSTAYMPLAQYMTISGDLWDDTGATLTP